MKSGQTYLELASEKRESFTWWLKSEHVSTADVINKLTLKEEFLKSVNKEVNLYILHKQFAALMEVTTEADGYVMPFFLPFYFERHNDL